MFSFPNNFFKYDTQKIYNLYFCLFMLQPITYDYNSSTYKIFNIPVLCDDFYATSKNILILANNTIKIYTHNKCTSIKLYKIIKHNLILFIDKKCIINILYRLLINNYKTIEDIILYLKVDNIRKVQEMTEGFLITYKDGSKVFYNLNLEIIEKPCCSVLKPLKINTVIKTGERSICIKKNEIEIDGRSFECGNILKVVGYENYLFIKNEKMLKVFVFEK